MTTKKVLKEMLKDESISNSTKDLNLALLITHETDNSIGFVPFTKNGNDILIVDYLSQGFLREVEKIIMVNSLSFIRENSLKTYNEIMKELSERYDMYNEIVEEIEKADKEIINKDVA